MLAQRVAGDGDDREQAAREGRLHERDGRQCQRQRLQRPAEHAEDAPSSQRLRRNRKPSRDARRRYSLGAVRDSSACNTVAAAYSSPETAAATKPREAFDIPGRCHIACRIAIREPPYPCRVSSDAEIRARIQEHWDASERGDVDVEHAIYADDAILDYPQSGERFRGRAGPRPSAGDIRRNATSPSAGSSAAATSG